MIPLTLTTTPGLALFLFSRSHDDFAAWATDKIALPEVGAGSGLYRATLPAAADDVYEVFTGSAAPTDWTTRSIGHVSTVGDKMAATIAANLDAPVSEGGAGTGSGDGDTAVNHDTGGADALAYLDAGGAGVDGATVRAYLKADYDAGTFTVRGRATTDSAGRWVAPMYLNSGLTYTLVFAAQGRFGPDTTEVTIP